MSNISYSDYFSLFIIFKQITTIVPPSRSKTIYVFSFYIILSHPNKPSNKIWTFYGLLDNESESWKHWFFSIQSF